MKKLMSKVSFLLAVVLLGSLALAQGPEGDGKKAGKGRGDRKGGGPIVRFDTDKDGVLSAEEVAAAKEAGAERFIQKVDTNEDGQVDAAEIEAMKEKMKGRRGRDGKPTAEQKEKWEKRRQEMILKRFDADKDGVLSEAEKAAAKAAHEEILKKYDADGDGQLGREERRKMMQERRGKGGQGGRGKGGKRGGEKPEDAPVIIE